MKQESAIRIILTDHKVFSRLGTPVGLIPKFDPTDAWQHVSSGLGRGGEYWIGYND